MTKKAKSEPQSNPDSQSRQMKLRSSGVLLPESVKITPSIKKPSLIGDKELDEMKIIREFQMKRKLLMKILKQKQKQKALSSAPIDPFQIKEGILQFQEAESQHQDSAFFKEDIQSLTPSSSDHHQNCQMIPDAHKENTEPVSIESVKVNVAIQTDKDFGKKRMVLRSARQSPRELPITQKKISKQGDKVRHKKAKKTKEDIQRLKNQITSLFVGKDSENQSYPQSSGQCQSLQSTLSCGANEEYLVQVSFMMKKLNNQIEAYYTGRYLTEVILKQYKDTYNRRKNTSPFRTPQHSSNQSFFGNNSIESDYSQISQNQLKINSKKPQPIKSSQPVKKIKYQIDQDKKQKLPNEQTNNSGSSKKSKSKHKGNRGLLNERFQIFEQTSEQEKTDQPLIKKFSETHKNESVSNKIKLSKDEFNEKSLKKQRQMMLGEPSETQSQAHHTKAWIKEFDMQVQLIYEKYPKLRKYQLTRKIPYTQNKHIQIDKIEDYCEKKTKKIAKISRLLKRNKQQKPKTFKEKIQTISKGKANPNYQSSFQDKKKIMIPNKAAPKIKLKEIEIVHGQEEEFCKSFDHRSRKGQKFVQSQFSQLQSQCLRDSELYDQIYDVLVDNNNYNNKSHQFYFSSSDSMERKSAKLENRKEQVSQNMSKSHVDTSREMNGERKITVGKSFERSFFKSQQGKDYFNMSGDNPLNF